MNQNEYCPLPYCQAMRSAIFYLNEQRKNDAKFLQHALRAVRLGIKCHIYPIQLLPSDTMGGLVTLWNCFNKEEMFLVLSSYLQDMEWMLKSRRQWQSELQKGLTVSLEDRPNYAGLQAIFGENSSNGQQAKGYLLNVLKNQFNPRLRWIEIGDNCIQITPQSLSHYFNIVPTSSNTSAITNEHEQSFNEGFKNEHVRLDWDRNKINNSREYNWNRDSKSINSKHELGEGRSNDRSVRRLKNREETTDDYRSGRDGELLDNSKRQELFKSREHESYRSYQEHKTLQFDRTYEHSANIEGDDFHDVERGRSNFDDEHRYGTLQYGTGEERKHKYASDNISRRKGDYRSDFEHKRDSSPERKGDRKDRSNSNERFSSRRGHHNSGEKRQHHSRERSRERVRYNSKERLHRDKHNHGYSRERSHSASDRNRVQRRSQEKSYGQSRESLRNSRSRHRSHSRERLSEDYLSRSFERSERSLSGERYRNKELANSRERHAQEAQVNNIGDSFNQQIQLLTNKKIDNSLQLVNITSGSSGLKQDISSSIAKNQKNNIKSEKADSKQKTTAGISFKIEKTENGKKKSNDLAVSHPRLLSSRILAEKHITKSPQGEPVSVIITNRTADNLPTFESSEIGRDAFLSADSTQQAAFRARTGPSTLRTIPTENIVIDHSRLNSSQHSVEERTSVKASFEYHNQQSLPSLMVSKSKNIDVTRNETFGQTDRLSYTQEFQGKTNQKRDMDGPVFNDSRSIHLANRIDDGFSSNRNPAASFRYDSTQTGSNNAIQDSWQVNKFEQTVQQQQPSRLQIASKDIDLRGIQFSSVTHASEKLPSLQAPHLPSHILQQRSSTSQEFIAHERNIHPHRPLTLPANSSVSQHHNPMPTTLASRPVFNQAMHQTMSMSRSEVMRDEEQAHERSQPIYSAQEQGYMQSQAAAILKRPHDKLQSGEEDYVDAASPLDRGRRQQLLLSDRINTTDVKGGFGRHIMLRSGTADQRTVVDMDRQAPPMAGNQDLRMNTSDMNSLTSNNLYLRGINMRSENFQEDKRSYRNFDDQMPHASQQDERNFDLGRNLHRNNINPEEQINSVNDDRFSNYDATDSRLQFQQRPRQIRSNFAQPEFNSREQLLRESNELENNKNDKFYLRQQNVMLDNNLEKRMEPVLNRPQNVSFQKDRYLFEERLEGEYNQSSVKRTSNINDYGPSKLARLDASMPDHEERYGLNVESAKFDYEQADDTIPNKFSTRQTEAYSCPTVDEEHYSHNFDPRQNDDFVPPQMLGQAFQSVKKQQDHRGLKDGASYNEGYDTADGDQLVGEEQLVITLSKNKTGRNAQQRRVFELDKEATISPRNESGMLLVERSKQTVASAQKVVCLIPSNKDLILHSDNNERFSLNDPNMEHSNKFVQDEDYRSGSTVLQPGNGDTDYRQLHEERIVVHTRGDSNRREILSTLPSDFHDLTNSNVSNELTYIDDYNNLTNTDEGDIYATGNSSYQKAKFDLVQHESFDTDYSEYNRRPGGKEGERSNNGVQGMFMCICFVFLFRGL